MPRRVPNWFWSPKSLRHLTRRFGGLTCFFTQAAKTGCPVRRIGPIHFTWTLRWTITYRTIKIQDTMYQYQQTTWNQPNPLRFNPNLFGNINLQIPHIYRGIFSPFFSEDVHAISIIFHRFWTPSVPTHRFGSCQDLDGRTALHYVACWGDLEVAKSLLAQGEPSWEKGRWYWKLT